MRLLRALPVIREALRQTAKANHKRCIRVSQERGGELGIPRKITLPCAACSVSRRHLACCADPCFSSFPSSPHIPATSGPDTPFSAAQLPAIPCEVPLNDCTESFWAFQRLLAIYLEILALAPRTTSLLRPGKYTLAFSLGQPSRSAVQKVRRSAPDSIAFL